MNLSRFLPSYGVARSIGTRGNCVGMTMMNNSSLSTGNFSPLIVILGSMYALLASESL